MSRRSTRRQHQHHLVGDVVVDPPIRSSQVTVGDLVSKPWFSMAAVAAVTLVGFYYSTNATMTNLKDNQVAQEKKADQREAEQKAAREKLAEAWQKNQEKNTEVLNLLATRLTVSEKAQERSDAILSKVADQLQQLNSRSVVVQPHR